jgi:hypothetical protein
MGMEIHPHTRCCKNLKSHMRTLLMKYNCTVNDVTAMLDSCLTRSECNFESRRSKHKLRHCSLTSLSESETRCERLI